MVIFVQNMDLELLMGFAEPQPVSINLVLPGQLLRILHTEWMFPHIGVAAAGRDQLQGKAGGSFRGVMSFITPSLVVLHFTLCLFPSLQLYPARPRKKKKKPNKNQNTKKQTQNKTKPYLFTAHVELCFVVYLPYFCTF